MNYYSLFRVRSWNNGMRCMSFYILMGRYEVGWVWIVIFNEALQVYTVNFRETHNLLSDVSYPRPALGVFGWTWGRHYNDVIMGAISSQITSPSIVYSSVYLSANQRKHRSSASLAYVRGIHQGPVNSPHKWPVTRKKFPFDDVIMVKLSYRFFYSQYYLRNSLNLNRATILAIVFLPSYDG